MKDDAATILDPVCGMIVTLEDARHEGLTLEHDGRDYGFCGASCREAFALDPANYAPKVLAWLEHGGGAEHPGHGHAGTELPAIDDGMRAWYRSCRCCLSDAYPRVVEVLDAEARADARPPAAAGICEVAEADA